MSTSGSVPVAYRAPKKRGRPVHGATGAPPRIEVLWRPDPGMQTEVLSCPVPDLFMGGARGPGKTACLVGDWLAHAARHGEHARGLLLRHTYAQLHREVHVSHLVPLLPKLGATFNAGTGVWQMPNGATLTLGYLEREQQAEQYQGGERTWIGIDELGNFPDPAPVDKLRAVLRNTHGIPCVMRATGNPGGPGQMWIRKRYIDPAPPKTPFQDPATGEWRVFVPGKLEGNPHITDPEAYIRALRGSGPAWLVQAWLKGDWNASFEGGVISPGWFRRYLAHRLPAEGKTFISVDTAMKAKEISDFTVAIVAREVEKRVYVAEVMRGKFEHPERRQKLRALAAKWQPTCVIIEDKGSGTDLLQDFREDPTWPWPLFAMEPNADKVIRMSTETPMIEEGRLYLPDAAPWSLDFEAELTTFPAAPHDDQVDALSQLLRYLREHVRTAQFARDMGTW
ncbi:MAG: phage terminase large subunit [Terriglobales bacterium]